VASPRATRSTRPRASSAPRASTSFFVQAGGDLYVRGKKPDGSAWRVGVRDPSGRDENDYFALLEVEDHAFSTAGDYERSFLKDGKRYHHIIDPRTGYPATASRSVTSGPRTRSPPTPSTTRCSSSARRKASSSWSRSTTAARSSSTSTTRCGSRAASRANSHVARPHRRHLSEPRSHVAPARRVRTPRSHATRVHPSLVQGAIPRDAQSFYHSPFDAPGHRPLHGPAPLVPG
jgi:hypothetical protein